jgi:hypothetical protein
MCPTYQAVLQPGSELETRDQELETQLLPLNLRRLLLASRIQLGGLAERRKKAFPR